MAFIVGEGAASLYLEAGMAPDATGTMHTS